MIQISIIKIRGYGPWTLTLGSDREHRLQILQASVYGQLQKLFSRKHGLLFLNRSDEFFAISNGISLEDHIDIQKSLQTLPDVEFSISVGAGETPYDANAAAFEAQKADRFADEQHNIYGSHESGILDSIIMHMDVDNLTGYQQTNSPYDTSNSVFRLYARLSDFFLKRKSLAFFIGGDNFMISATEDARQAAQQCIDEVRAEGIILNCGIGRAETGREAARRATRSLDAIRELRDSGSPDRPYIHESL